MDADLAHRFIAFAEEDAAPGKMLRGLPVLDVREVERRDPDTVRLCAAIGSPDRRRLVERFRALGFSFETLSHPTARRGPGSRVGDGCIVMANSLITTDVEIGDHVIVNVGCVVSHDVRVGDFVTLSPGVYLNGNVIVGSGVFIGTGAIVIPRIRIGDGAVLAAGACVVRDVSPGATVGGVPAVPLRVD